jgi:hypothetical protein
MSLVEQTCHVVIVSSGPGVFGIDFSGSLDGVNCGKPFFGYIGEVPACREHLALYGEYLSFLSTPRAVTT